MTNRATPPLPPGPLKLPKARGRTTRHERGRMNQTEARYFADRLDPAFLSSEYLRVEFERVTLLLAPDTRYTPDFFVLRRDGGIEFHEVKAFMEDDAWVKLKVAAEQWPMFTFVLAKSKRKEEGPGWHIKTVGE